MHSVALSLGCNLGNCGDTLRAAIRDLQAIHEGADPLVSSSVYETEPWGRTGQPKFLNLAAIILTRAEPLQLLRTLQDIERRHGRVRHERWGQRTLDIDVLLYDDLVIELPDLSVPHRLMHLRRFVLVPLAEIAHSWVHPVLGRSVSELTATLTDDCNVTLIGRLDSGGP